MTTQISDSVLIVGRPFYEPHFANLPQRHPSLAACEEPIHRSSALHRGYVAQWEIREDGRLFLDELRGRYRMKNGPIHAKWFSAVTSVSVGEVDETRSRKIRYETVRMAELELDVQKGTVVRWRLVLSGKRGQRWKKGFDWQSIAKAMATYGIGPEYQPPRHTPKWVHGDEELAELAATSARLLERARNGAADCGKKIEDGAWVNLSKGWADPFPELDYHGTVQAFRGQFEQFKAQLS